MRLLVTLLVGLLCFHDVVFAELSVSSCSLLRSVTSLTTIVPEIAQLAMRSYRGSPSPAVQQRPKRSLANGMTLKDSPATVKGSVLEQMIANTIRDVNFTNVVLLILKNNDTMNKIQNTVDSDAIIRMIVREIDQEKLLTGLWNAAGHSFDLEHFIDSLINRTHLDVLHEELLTSGTLPEWFVKSIHPDLSSQLVQRMFATVRNVTSKFVRVLSKSERVDNYLFNMIVQQALTPISGVIQKVKESKPKTFDQLIEIIANNANKAIMGQMFSSTQRATTKKSGKKVVTSTVSPVDINNEDEVKSMLYQWSVALEAMGQSVRVLFKSLEQLYCTSV